MNSHRFYLIVGSLLLIFVVAACALSPASSSTGSTSVPAAATNMAVSAATATNLPVSASGSGNCANAYFPVSTGNSWSYSSTGGALGTYTYTMTVADVSDNVFTTTEVSSLGTGTASIVKWKCKDGKLAALDAGSNSLSMSGSKFSMTSNSITADGYNIPGTFGSGTTWSEKVTVKGTIQAGTRTLDSQIVSKVDCSTAGTDTITGPAGTFNTVKATCNQTVAVSALVQGTPMPAGAPVPVSITNWYAKGVGLVQSVRSTAGSTENIVLTQYGNSPLSSNSILFPYVQPFPHV
jgi:hypothetical protein